MDISNSEDQRNIDTAICIHMEDEFHLQMDISNSEDQRRKMDTIICIHMEDELSLQMDISHSEDQGRKGDTIICIHMEDEFHIQMDISNSEDQRRKMDTVMASAWRISLLSRWPSVPVKIKEEKWILPFVSLWNSSFETAFLLLKWQKKQNRLFWYYIHRRY
ncbi:hypothetical protein J6590_086390 [Homalodisca vitripennis]|nr:hypothetical protein J6590_086390 [Homalodisca vitripennis]